MGSRPKTKENRRIPSFFLSMLLAVAMVSCKEPVPTHQLCAIAPEGITATDSLHFVAPMPDAGVSYRIGFTARTEQRLPVPFWDLEVVATSPSGKIYREQVRLPVERRRIEAYLAQCRQEGLPEEITLITTHAGNDLTWNYREGIRPDETGEWQLTLRFLSQEPITGLHCFGLTCIPEDHEQ